MRLGPLFPLLLIAAPSLAQTTASEAAKKFDLDPSALQAEGSVTVRQPAEGPPATAADEEAMAADAAAAPPAAPATAPGGAAPLTLDTPIAALIADPRGKAVLDRDLPGLSTDENLDKFAAKSLRQFQPLTGGQLTDAMLAKVEADLGAGPTRSKPVERRRDER